MALADRDYMNPASSRPPVGEMHMWTVTTWIIVINVVVFLFNNLFPIGLRYTDEFGRQAFVPLLKWYGSFSIDAAVRHVQVWRFITFQFLHANLTHILFNMLALYFFGPMIESYLGRRRFLAFYLL